MPSLHQLFPEHAGHGADRPVAGLSADSRTVKPGFAFVAVPGAKAHGLAYVAQAVANGAIAIVAEERTEGLPETIAFLPTANARQALALAAARLFPAQPSVVAAVTGTSGKTSVAAFARQIWLALGHPAASLGTIGLVGPSGAAKGALTTPDPLSLHETLDGIAREGVTHLAMEASSHGLDQRRLDGVRLAAGAFTNLSRDHLDYHPDLASYLQAKLGLFERLLQPGQPAVIDADSDAAEVVVAACRRRGLDVLTTGAAGTAIRLLDHARQDLATRLTLEHAGRRYDVMLPLLGRFQVANALVAAGLCIGTSGEPEAVFAALDTLQGAPGRLECVGSRNSAPVFIDYAHKPDALEKAIQALRPLTAGRLVVVFGAGGDRDPGKRPIMGAIAAREADVAIVTDDNPRSEDPRAIRAAILAAAPKAIEIGDRRAAIAHAIGLLAPGDTLLVAGKGHETGQIVGASILPFSDHEAVAAALQDLA